MKSLFAFQMINETFRCVIAASKPLQRKMFLLTDPSARSLDKTALQCLNPLLLDLPIFKALQFWAFKHYENGVPFILINITSNTTPFPHSAATAASQSSTTPSWRNMHIISLPIKLRIKFCSFMTNNPTLKRELKSPANTLGALADNIAAHEPGQEFQREMFKHRGRSAATSETLDQFENFLLFSGSAPFTENTWRDAMKALGGSVCRAE